MKGTGPRTTRSSLCRRQPPHLPRRRVRAGHRAPEKPARGAGTGLQRLHPHRGPNAQRPGPGAAPSGTGEGAPPSGPLRQTRARSWREHCGPENSAQHLDLRTASSSGLRYLRPSRGPPPFSSSAATWGPWERRPPCT